MAAVKLEGPLYTPPSGATLAPKEVSAQKPVSIPDPLNFNKCS